MKSKLKTAALGVLAGMVLLSGCGGKQGSSAATAKSPVDAVPPKTNIFFVKGVVRELQPDGKTVVIDHEEIPNYMEAMTMPFRVLETNELAGVRVGDEVFFRMLVTDYEGWIDRVSRTGETKTPAAPAADAKPKGTFRRVRDVMPLNIGDALPNYPLTNHLGQAFSLGQFKGQALAITFIFTRCPFPEFCPRMGNHFAEAAKKLAADASGPTNWHLISISFDPEFDTPGIMRGYASRFQAGAERWTFATGAQIEIDAITEQFGMGFSREGGSFNHNLRTAVIDANGRVQSILIGNEWKPDELVAEMAKAARVAPTAGADARQRN